MKNSRKKFNEIEYPKPDIEYWVVVDEKTEIPHYFKTEEKAKDFADYYGHTIIFKECFN